MKTTIELIFEKTKENKQITDLCVSIDENPDIDLINTIYPQPQYLKEDGKAQAWREENLGARYLYARDHRDYGDEIVISIIAEGGTGYSFFKYFAAKYPEFIGKANVEINTGTPQTWFIERGQIAHQFDEYHWTEKIQSILVDHYIRPARTAPTNKEAEQAAKYHNQGAICAQSIAACVFNYGGEILSEAHFYYSGLDEDEVYSHPEYVKALNKAKNAYKEIRSKVFTITRGDDIIFSGDLNEFKKFTEVAKVIL